MMPRTSTQIPTTPLRLHLFGPFRAERGTEPIRFPTRKVDLLLAYLVLHPEEHLREKLAALFWGDMRDAQARQSLRTAVQMLRKPLGSELVLADRETMRLNSGYPLWADVREFEQQACLIASGCGQPDSLLELYTDDLLAEYYDDWVIREREYYRQRYVEALLHSAQQLRAQGEYARAIQFGRCVLKADPANERAHQQVMFCHAALGDRSAALEQYDTCRRVLREELAVAPAAETLALYRWIKHARGEAQTPEGLITNLPIPLTSFVGRKAEFAYLRTLLPDQGARPGKARLLTLTGAGGSGKTRLAVQLGTDLLDRFADGVWWVDLAALADDTAVPHTVARSLGVRERADKPVIESLIEHLRSKTLLLLLDNCEHLVTSCARLAEILLTNCPGLTILATSREALAVVGETVWYVPTLAVPDPAQCPSLAEIAHYDGIQLFVERARAIRPDFTLSPDNAPSVVRVCTHLDGIPLAIELAAARLKVLTVEQIAERLVDRFNLLTNGSRTALPRQRTLRATLDWSYGLLTDQEQRLFERLAVFAGGWTVDAVETVCAGEPLPASLILELLTQLVEKSLVVVQAEPAGARYRMLETLRQYAARRLDEHGECQGIRQRHAHYYARLVEAAESGLQSLELGAWLDRLEIEHDNVRAAIQWSLQSDGAETGLRVAGALGVFWRRRGYLREGSAWLERLLARGEQAPPQQRARAMAEAAWLARFLGDYHQAIALQDECVRLFRKLGHRLGMAEVLIQRGILAVYRNELVRAIACFQESLSLYEALGEERGRALAQLFLGHAALFNSQWDKQAKTYCEQAVQFFQSVDDPTEQAHAHIILGAGSHLDGDDERARRHLEVAVGLCRSAGDKRQLGWSTAVLSWIILSQGKIDEAWSVAKSALGLALELGEKTIAVNAVIFSAEIMLSRSEVERAARLMACALAVGEAFGFRPTPHLWADIHPALDAMRAALGLPAFEAAWAAGEAMNLEEATADILGAQDREDMA